MLHKVDIHTHILPPTLPLECGISLRHQADGLSADMLRADGSLFRKVECNCWDAPQRLRECEAFGVSVQVLSTVPVLFNYHLSGEAGLRVATALNDHIAQLVREHPTRFAGLATLPMQDPALACRELRRCMTDLGLSGAQIGSHVNDRHLGDPSFEPLYALAADLGAALFVHPWDMAKTPHQQSHWKPWLIGMPHETADAYYSLCASGVLERHPTLRVAFAHGGGAFPLLLGRMDHGYQARPDLCAVDNPRPPSTYASRVWVDSHVGDADTLRFVMSKVGADKMTLGSDYPFPLGELSPGALIEGLGLDAGVQRKLLVDNALAWLGRTEASFKP